MEEEKASSVVVIAHHAEHTRDAAGHQGQHEQDEEATQHGQGAQDVDHVPQEREAPVEEDCIPDAHEEDPVTVAVAAVVVVGVVVATHTSP